MVWDRRSFQLLCPLFLVLSFSLVVMFTAVPALILCCAGLFWFFGLCFELELVYVLNFEVRDQNLKKWFTIFGFLCKKGRSTKKPSGPRDSGFLYGGLLHRDVVLGFKKQHVKRKLTHDTLQKKVFRVTTWQAQADRHLF